MAYTRKYRLPVESMDVRDRAVPYRMDHIRRCRCVKRTDKYQYVVSVYKLVFKVCPFCLLVTR